jgi:two-component system chemotaxis response regulator CheB
MKKPRSVATRSLTSENRFPLKNRTTTAIKSSSREKSLSQLVPKASHQEIYSHKAVTKSSGKEYSLLAIGTSTGGPVALQKILTQFDANFPVPIIMVQHMPAAFTAAFASRLNSLCNITVKEASDGDVLKPGCAYLAPGGRQMIITGSEKSAKIKILDDNSPKITFKPSVDISFGSAAKTFAGKVLAAILTGMGSDGKEGARMLKAKGATIWSQDEQSCVVYGMPQAIDKAGISQLSLPLDLMAVSMAKEINCG